MGRYGTLTRTNKLTCSKVVYQYSWVISGFRPASYPGYSGESPRFSTGENNQYDWALILFTGGIQGHEDYVSLRLYLHYKNNHENSQFIFEASIVDKEGNKLLTKSQLLTQKTINETAGTFENFVLKSDFKDKKELLVGGDLRLLCEISCDNYIDQGVSFEVTQDQRSHDNLTLEYFAKLLNDDKFSDFTFIVGEKEFPVHRAILSARSRVFETMFTSDMSESHERKTIIEDVDADTMEKLLHFVYVGRVDEINEEMVKKLIVAADKYELETLKHICEDLLVKQMSTENIYEIFKYADMYNASKIKKKAIGFLRVNSKKLSADDDFEDKIRSLPKELQTDIICSFMKNF